MTTTGAIGSIPRKFVRALGLYGLALGLVWASGCASVKKKEPELDELVGKKVALIDVDGEETARKVVEVALVNQLIQNGTFILVPKAEILRARDAADLKPTDWQELTRRVGADYALRAKVLEFDTQVSEGHNTESVYDSQLEAETGNGKMQRVFRAKVLEGKVRVELSFVRIFDGDTRTAIAEAQDRIMKEAKTEAIHLPPPLRFLEDLANRAFKEFFERYH